MLLRSHRIIGYDIQRMMFDFTMLTPDAKTVACSISGSAMDRLIGKSGCMPNEREALFSELRAKIEDIASSVYDLENPSHVYIFSKHVEVAIGTRGRVAVSHNGVLVSPLGVRVSQPDRFVHGRTIAPLRR